MKRGLVDMLIASLMFAIMGALVYQTKVWNAGESPMMASFLRVFFNLIVVVILSFFVHDRDNKVLGIRGLFGNFRGSLWLRGFFGSLSVMTVFYSIHAIGIGESGFLTSSSAVWVGLLSPWVLGQKNTKWGWIAILASICGLYMLYQPDFGADLFWGRTVALASGFFAAIAYTMVARSGRTNHPLTIVFYFVFVATVLHLLWFFFQPIHWPQDTRIWLALIGAGVAATLAQLFMTRSYQRAPAAMASAVSYAAPVFNMIFAVVLFHDRPNTRSLLGATIVLLAGVALPFFRGAIHDQKKTELAPEASS